MTEQTRIEKLMDMTSIATITEINKRQGAEKVQRAYIDNLWAKAKSVNIEPEWQECFNTSVFKDGDIERYIEPMLNALTGRLVHQNKIALDMVTMERDLPDDKKVFVIYVQTN